MNHPDAIQDPTAAPADWSENLVFTLNHGDVSVWAHWGRIAGAAHIWEAVLVVLLPDGKVRTSREFAVTPALTFHCVEPGERWRLTFDGMVRPTTADALAAGPQADGHIEHLTLDLEFTGIHELFGGVATDQTWASAHFDQGGRITGTVAGHAIDGAGFRDHSYGARDYSKIVGDTWCTAVFPSGKAFLAIEVWQQDGPAHVNGFTFDGTTLTPTQELDVPRLETTAGAPHAFELRVGDARMQVRQEANFTMTFGRPVGLVMGARLDDPELPVITEGPATVTWDGETADGWIEKSLRLSNG